MADGEENELCPEEKLVKKHRKELKEFQAEIQRLKHSYPKGDKKRKKEVTAQIALREAELEAKHEKEIQELHNGDVDALTEGCARTNLDDNDPPEAVADAGQMILKSQKQSKAQKRRDKKAQQEKDREDRIREQEVENLTGSRHVEAQKLKKLLGSRSLGIFEIPSDGNCLYAAVADQLRRLEIQTTVDSLRRQAANHMRMNEDDFLPFLCKPETGELYTPEEYLDYCDRLENTPEWGGQLELRALSNVVQKSIEVIQADAPSITLGEEYPEPKLILSYHHHAYGLGEHYNSVVDKALLPAEDEEEEFT